MFKLPLLGMSVMLLSCSRADVEQNHHEAVMKCYKQLPIADSIKKKFGAWSFITHWNIPNNPKYGFRKNEKEWQTLTYMYGRYELIYAQRVILEKNGGVISEPIGEPQILIAEISRIFGDPNAPTTDWSDFQIAIAGAKLEKLVKSDWDFASIGINLKKDAPVRNILWKYNDWNRIYPLQPVKY